MPPHGGEGQPKAKPKAVDKSNHSIVILPPKKNISQALPGLTQATKPVPRAAAKKMQDNQQSMADLSARALRATRAKQAEIIKNQKPSLLNADVLGLHEMPGNALRNTRRVIRDIENPHRLVEPYKGPVDPRTGLAPVNAGIAFPGTGGRLAQKVFGRLTPEAENLVLPGSPMAIPEQAALRGLRKSVYTTAQRIRDAQPAEGGFGPSLLTQKAAINRAGRSEQAQAYKNAISQGASHEDAMKAMGGKFKTIPLPEHLAPGWTENDLKYLKDYAQHATNDTFSTIRANEALNKIAGGEVPVKSEVHNLIDVFGTEFKRADKQINGWMKAREGFHNLLNAPRTLQATADVSGTFRQALQAGITHPVIWAKNLRPQFKSLVNEDYYHSFVDSIIHRPNADLYERGGLRVTDIGKGVKRGQREEAYQSPWLEEVRRGHKISGAPSAVIRASGRAYTALLDGIRADMFDELHAQITASGRLNGISAEEYDHYLRSLAEYVNNATGQGGRKFGRHAASLNTFFWSPRLIASRANLLNPLYYAGLHPAVRREALTSLFAMMAFAGTTLGIARKAGLSVNLNPRSSDFAKIRHGDTRIDVLGGTTQLPVLAARTATRQKQSTMTGVVQDLTGAVGKGSLGDVYVNFLRGKANPALGVPMDWAFNKTVTGQPFSAKNELVSHVTPLSFQDAANIGDVTNPAQAPQIAAGLIGSGLGIGVQSYAKRQPARTKQLIQDAKASGVWQHNGNKLPPTVKSDLEAKDQLDAELGNYDGKSYSDKLEHVVIPAYVAKYPQSEQQLNAAFGQLKGNDTYAKTMYFYLLHGNKTRGIPSLFPSYEYYNEAIHMALDAKLGK